MNKTKAEITLLMLSTRLALIDLAMVILLIVSLFSDPVMRLLPEVSFSKYTTYYN
jgi:hypothetical protein